MVRMLGFRVMSSFRTDSRKLHNLRAGQNVSDLLLHYSLYLQSKGEPERSPVPQRSSSGGHPKIKMNALEYLDRALLSILWQRGRLRDLKVNKDSSVHNRQQRKDDRRKTHSWLGDSRHPSRGAGSRNKGRACVGARRRLYRVHVLSPRLHGGINATCDGLMRKLVGGWKRSDGAHTWRVVLRTRRCIISSGTTWQPSLSAQRPPTRAAPLSNVPRRPHAMLPY